MNKNKYLKVKKADIVLAILLVIVGLACSFFVVKPLQKQTGTVVIYQGEKLFGKYNLNEDKSIDIKKGQSVNKVSIKDGKVQMQYSNCKNQDCIHQGKISDGSKSIVCLPNKIVIKIEGKKDKFDAVSN
ncbi:MAG: NusG domain II-containing protein [Eubacteriales bacterium]|nr:NusG domain II-containing protein [Eubacteriales bacterium]MDY3332539.1 NusG domain II-containing protein [Gallibacter sp.]